LQEVLDQGIEKPDRTGTGTLSVFGRQLRFDLSHDVLPVITTKRVHLKSVIHELLWFLQGDTNTNYLKKNGISIWDEWADDRGRLGPIYGQQWRGWGAHSPHTRYSPMRIDQFKEVIQQWRGWGAHSPHTRYSPMRIDQFKEVMAGLKANPFGRRHIVNAWNVGELVDMALPPCHLLFQFYVRPLRYQERRYLAAHRRAGPDQEFHPDDFLMNDDAREVADLMDKLEVPKLTLSTQVYQRSADLFLGVPFNITSYSLLTHMVAHCCGYATDELVWTGGDVHLYNNHIEQAKTQLLREPMKTPRLKLRDTEGKRYPWEFEYEDIEILDYRHHPKISAPVAV
jgi:thymidylate synthase